MCCKKGSGSEGDSTYGAFTGGAYGGLWGREWEFGRWELGGYVGMGVGDSRGGGIV